MHERGGVPQLDKYRKTVFFVREPIASADEDVTFADGASVNQSGNEANIAKQIVGRCCFSR